VIAFDTDAECRSRLLAKGVVLPASVACIDIDTVVKNLATAEYRFNKPDQAFVDEPFRVVLVLPTAPGQDVESPFTGTEGKVETREARFSRYMDATLRGDPDLKITPSGPQERVTTSVAPTIWDWMITPEKAGDKNLVIEVNALIVVGSDKNRVQLPTIRETIRVDVRPYHRVSTLWDAFVNFLKSFFGLLTSAATVIIAGFSLLYWLKTRSAKEIPGADDIVAHGTLHKDHDPAGPGHQDQQPKRDTAEKPHPPDGHEMPP